MSKLSTRVRSLSWLAGFSLLLFSITRLLLLAYSWNDSRANAFELLKVLGLGVAADLISLSYLLPIPALLVLLWPNAWTKNPWARSGLWFSLSLYVYSLWFNLAAELLFWQEFSTRFNFIAVDYLVYRREVAGNIQESYPLPAILIGLACLSAASLWLGRRQLSQSLQAPLAFKSGLAYLCTLLGLMAGSFVLTDGPWEKWSANSYHNELSHNGIYQLFHAFRHNNLDYMDFYATVPEAQASALIRQQLPEATAQLEQGPYPILRHIQAQGEPKKLNVMLIMVESLSGDYLATFGNQQHITPNLDRLYQESLSFTRLYATGTRTVRGLEAGSLSMPPTPGSAIVKRPNNGNLFSLASVFNQQGYHSQFLYGGYGYFDNMNTFFGGNGFEVVDRNQFTESEIGFANVWGMADEYLFDRAIKEANRDYQRGQPFFQYMMTTSNHRPFSFPNGRIDLPSGSREGAVKYTDYAIQHLIDQARKQPWFDDTVFVIVADHCAASAGKSQLPVARYHIPMLFYSPKHLPAQKVDTLASQIDLAPTLLARLNISYDSKFFGTDILALAPEQGRAFVATYQQLGYLTEHGLAILSPKRQMEFQADPWNNGPIENQTAEHPAIAQEISWYQAASLRYQLGLQQNLPQPH